MGDHDRLYNLYRADAYHSALHDAPPLAACASEVVAATTAATTATTMDAAAAAAAAAAVAAAAASTATRGATVMVELPSTMHDELSPPSDDAPSTPRAPPSAVTSLATPTATKRRRFRFKERHDVAMLQAVLNTRAHVAPHGQAQRLFDDATALLFERGAFADVTDGPLPTGKTVWDRFRHLVHTHRSRGLLVTAERGELFSERLRLLDMVVAEVDRFRGEREAHQQRMQREHFVIRRRFEGARGGTASASASACLKRLSQGSCERAARRRRVDDGGMFASCDELVSDVAGGEGHDVSSDDVQRASSPTEDEAARTDVAGALERLRLELELRRMEADEMERQRRVQIEERFMKLEERRAAVEVRRLQLEEEERKNARMERQLLTELVSSLANGLLNNK